MFGWSWRSSGQSARALPFQAADAEGDAGAGDEEVEEVEDVGVKDAGGEDAVCVEAVDAQLGASTHRRLRPEVDGTN